MTSTARATTGRQAQRQDDSEYRVIDLRRFIVALWKRRYFVAGWALGGMLLAYGSAWLIHPQYDATVRMMPPTPKSMGLSLSLLTGGHNSGDQYLGLLKSRTVTDDVIAHQHLSDYFHTKKPSALRKALDGMVKISVDKDQFVTVRVRAKEPETALRIANEFPAALYRLSDAMAFSSAEHQLHYFEGPLEEEKDRLAQAEDALTIAQQKTGMIEPESQVRLGVGAIAGLRQQLMSRQQQLAGLETGRTSENPQVVFLKSEIDRLEGQIHTLESQTGGGGTPAISAKMPGLALEVLRKERDVKYHETLFELLSKQYEGTKIDEAYASPMELVDKAVFPDEKSWPPRKWFALAGLMLGAIVGAGYVVLKQLELRRRIRGYLEQGDAEAMAGMLNG